MKMPNKIKIRLFIGMLGLLAVLYSCNRKQDPETRNDLAYFLLQQQIGVYVNGVVIIRYDEYESQFAYNVKRKTFRLQANDQGVYAHLIFSQLPIPTEDIPVEVGLDYKTGQETRSIRISMGIVKREGNVCWLWEESSKTGVIMWKNPEDGVIKQ